MNARSMAIENYCIECKQIARDDCEDRGHVVGTLGQLTEEEAQLAIGAMPLQGLPNEPEATPEGCYYCSRERPWLKNGIWIHAGGVACQCPPEQPAPHVHDYEADTGACYCGDVWDESREQQPAPDAKRFGFVILTGRYKILDYYKPDGQQIATADSEDAARLIVRSLNTAAVLVPLLVKAAEFALTTPGLIKGRDGLRKTVDALNAVAKERER